MLKDRAFCDRLQEVLKEEFFDLKYLRVFARKLFNYRTKYGLHPSAETVGTVIRSDLGEENEAIQVQVRDYFAHISANDLEIDDEQFIKDTALDFCRKQTLKVAMVEVMPLVNSCSFEKIAKIITDATQKGADNNFGYDYKVDFEERFLPNIRNPVSTGWPEIDRITRGGMGEGDLVVVIGASGAGKSHCLVHFGAAALKQGKNVVHYTMELSSTTIALRYDSCLTGYEIDKLYRHKQEVHEMVDGIQKRLIVKEYPARKATPATISAHLAKLKQHGIEPGAIIVDYADLLRSVNSYGEKRHDLESIYEDLRAIGKEYGVPVYTVSQGNRSAVNKEIITSEEISEAYSKCFVSDFIMSLSRTTQDKASNGGRFFIIKNRNGPDGMVFPISFDTSCTEIRVQPQSEQSPEVISEVLREAKHEALKARYQRHQEEQRINNETEQK